MKDSGSKGLMFSPTTSIGDQENVTRVDFIKKLMPELNRMYPGDIMKLKSYPDLKQIIQLGHANIRGVLKFRDVMVYANPQISLF